MGTHPIFESDFDCLTDDHKSDKNKWQSCLWKRRSETKSMKIFSKRASWLPKRSAKEMRDGCTRMSKTSEICRSSKPVSLTSRGFLKQQFSWRHFYWVLTNEGVEYLREYLHLPPEIVPVTMKKQAKIVDNRPRGGGRVGVPTQAYSRDQKDAYRRVEKDANVGPGEGVYTFRGAGRGGAPQ